MAHLYPQHSSTYNTAKQQQQKHSQSSRKRKSATPKQYKTWDRIQSYTKT